MKLQLTLAWRYMNGRKLRTFLTTLAVIFGVMIIFGMNIILPTMLQSFQSNMMAASGLVDLTITHQSGSGFPMEAVQKLDGIEGIRAISPVLERTVNLPADFVDSDPARQDRISALNLVGVEPEAAQALQVYLVQEPGRFLQAGDTNAAVISQSLADAYHPGALDGGHNRPERGGHPAAAHPARQRGSTGEPAPGPEHDQPGRPDQHHRSGPDQPG
jgi:putative ABC transport system permease protein